MANQARTELNVTESVYWKDRSASRIGKRIEASFAEEPNFEDRLQREARQRAFSSLGLSNQQSELDEIER